MNFHRDKDLGDPSFFHSQLKAAEKAPCVNKPDFVLSFFVSGKVLSLFFLLPIYTEIY